MRLVGVWVWMLINLMFFAMAGYMFLLWLQLWRYGRNQEPLGDSIGGGRGQAKYNVSRAFLPQVYKGGQQVYKVVVKD